jgi:uncharacterized protein (TIGR03437 family)
MTQVLRAGLFAVPLLLAAQTPRITAVVNAANYADGPVTPGMIVTLFGTNIGPPTLTNLAVGPDGIVVSELAATRVLFEGVPAPLIYVSATQSAAVVPYGMAARVLVNVQVEYQGQRSESIVKMVAPVSPGIFALDASGRGGGAIVNPNGTINTPSNPAQPGDTVLVYFTGEGLVRDEVPSGGIATGALFTRATFSAEIGGRPATVFYTGAAPGNVFGFAQANITVPMDLTASGNLPIVLRSGDVASQANLTIAVAGAGPATVTSVFLIHGLNQSASDMNALRGTLTGPSGLDPALFTVDAAFDFSDCTQRLGCPASCTLTSGAQRLAEHMIARDPPGDVVLIGYSLGGLLARDLIANNWSNIMGRYRIRLITLASPSLGYPFTSLDTFASCGTLLREMDGNWRMLTMGMPQLSAYLTDVTAKWGNRSFPGASTWLTASGRFCANPSRTGSPSVGCRDANPRSDGVVCDDSAAYAITAPQGTLPTRRWQDPSAIYAHTASSFGALILGCAAQTNVNLVLSNPPPGPLLDEILAAIRGTVPPVTPSAIDVPGILSMDPEAQRKYVRAAIAEGFPSNRTEALALLLRNLPEAALAELEDFVTSEPDRSGILVSKAAEWIAFAGNDGAAAAIERLGVLDTRFAPLGQRVRDHSMHGVRR